MSRIDDQRSTDSPPAGGAPSSAGAPAPNGAPRDEAAATATAATTIGGPRPTEAGAPDAAPPGGPVTPVADPQPAPPAGAPPKPDFALRPGVPLAAELARVAQEQIDVCAWRLRGGATVGAEDVHESRKSLKRLRALTRLLRPALGAERYRRENGELRDAAAHLAGARDAEVMVLTLEALVRPDAAAAEAAPYLRLHTHLQAERERAGARLLADAGPARSAAADLEPVRERVSSWLDAGAGFGALEPGLRRIYREGRERYRAARRDPAAEHLQEWRKRVKDLRYCAELLSPLDPARLPKLAARADRLGEMLGDEHDLAVLAAFAKEHPELFPRAEDQRSLLKLIARRRRGLRRSALKLGSKMYARRPQLFARRIARRATRPQ